VKRKLRICRELEKVAYRISKIQVHTRAPLKNESIHERLMRRKLNHLHKLVVQAKDEIHEGL